MVGQWSRKPVNRPAGEKKVVCGGPMAQEASAQTHGREKVSWPCLHKLKFVIKFPSEIR